MRVPSSVPSRAVTTLSRDGRCHAQRERSAAIVSFGHLSPLRALAYISRVDDELDTERSQLLVCEECGCESDDDAHGWEGHLAQEEDGSVTVVLLSDLRDRGVGARCLECLPS